MLTGGHQVHQFTCGEPALDTWLVHHALQAQGSGSARVYVATLADNVTVVGFYALVAAQVEPGDATPRALKGQPARRPVPAILLARLAVDRDHQAIGLGQSLLRDALLRCVTAADAIGARVVLVHAKHEAARAWYRKLGFEQSPTDPFHLLLLLKDVRALLR